MYFSWFPLLKDSLSERGSDDSHGGMVSAIFQCLYGVPNQAFISVFSE